MTTQKFSDDETFALIKEYQVRPCLWQKSTKFKNNVKKANNIAEIASVLNVSEETVKEKLRSLRTIYFQNLQKVKKGQRGCNGGGVSQPRWKFFNALSFLKKGDTNDDDLDSNASVINSQL